MEKKYLKLLLTLETALKNKPDDLSQLFGKTARKFKLWPLSKIELLKVYRDLVKKGSLKTLPILELFLKRRQVRSLSGVAVISVLTKSYPCPGKCAYCPRQKDMPVSYLSNEPAVMRAVGCHFDPYTQVQTRLTSLKLTGHPTDKLELIVIGGTWSYLPKTYQTWFIKRCFQAANDFPSSKTNCEETLETLQKINQDAKHRIIGLTLETRPDFITPTEITRLRKLGCTRIELGLQTLDDQVLKLVNRGHTVRQTRQALKLLKDAGFKICVHLMPNLPGATPKTDWQTFEKLFSDADFRPDMLKIYPTVVVKGSRLYTWWKKGQYKPYTTQILTDLLLRFKKIIPPYVRVNRLIRDIPNTSIEAGNKISNLREILQTELKKSGAACRCIRCREIKDTNYLPKSIKLQNLNYQSSGGEEYFLSFEDPTQDKLLAFLRLRLPEKTSKHYLPELNGAALIREVHTYGHLVQLQQIQKGAAQHAGWGKKLLLEAEKIARQKGYLKMAVISGVGVRGYYQKLGYHLEGTYMVKDLI